MVCTITTAHSSMNNLLQFLSIDARGANQSLRLQNSDRVCQYINIDLIQNTHDPHLNKIFKAV